MSASSERAERTAAETTVLLVAHLHARPAGALVRAAAKFVSTVEITSGGRTVDVRGVLGVLSLGATAGSTVTLRATGADAGEALRALTEVLATAQ